MDHLGRLVRDGTIPNAGEPYAPRIRRCDLPRKPGFDAPAVDKETIRVGLKEQIARSIAESNTGGSDG